MFRLARWFAAAALLGWSLFASGSHGQVVVRYSPHVVYRTHYWGYTFDPYGSYLHGAADVIRAQGQFIKDRQQGLQMFEEYRRSKLDTRRKEIEQWLWERENLPTIEQERERVRSQELDRARNFPPNTEILAARPLNFLLANSQKLQLAGLEAPAEDLDPKLLAHIHVTSASGGNIGVLKRKQFFWPYPLRRAAFDTERTRIDALIAQAVQQTLQKGGPDVTVLDEITNTINGLDLRLADLSKPEHDDEGWTPSKLVEARRCLRQFRDALAVLQQPDAADYLNGNYSAQGKNVAELVKHMAQNGFVFAPATPGDERYYVVLHRVLAAYDEKLQAMTSTSEMKRPK